MITTVHAHKSGVVLLCLSKSFQTEKIKELRRKMTKIDSRGGGSLAITGLEANFET